MPNGPACGPQGIGPARKGDWKLIKFWEGHHEFYDLAEDLGESKDLSKQHPDKAAALDFLLVQRLKETGARLPKPNPEFREKP